VRGKAAPKFPARKRCIHFVAQRREGAKKVLARPVILQSYFGEDGPVTVIAFLNGPLSKNQLRLLTKFDN
jgi:hypothetical protein